MDALIARAKAALPYVLGGVGGVAYHAFLHPTVKTFIAWLNTIVNG